MHNFRVVRQATSAATFFTLNGSTLLGLHTPLAAFGEAMRGAATTAVDGNRTHR
jgi:hypothetical protein